MPMCVLYLSHLSWTFGFKEIKEYTTVTKLTELQKHRYPIQMLHFKNRSCLSSGKRCLEQSTYNKHTDSTILLKFHRPIKYSEWVFCLFYFTDGYRVPTISKREHALQEVLKMFKFTKFLLLYILKTQAVTC